MEKLENVKPILKSIYKNLGFIVFKLIKWQSHLWKLKIWLKINMIVNIIITKLVLRFVMNKAIWFLLVQEDRGIYQAIKIHWNISNKI